MTIEDIKTLERMVSHLMASKEIPQSTMNIVRPLISNIGIAPEDRYRTIIRMLEKLPEKSGETEKNSKERLKTANPQNINNEFADHSHTETSLYIDSLYKKFKQFKFFKIRYLVRRSNHFNIGFKKRLVPSKKLLKALEDLYAMQDEILERLPAVSSSILNDKEINDPTSFNYLRLIRNWLTARPFAAFSYSAIKWMERSNFERELKDYLYNAFSIRRIDSKKKDHILKQLKDKLYLMDDFAKIEIRSEDPNDLKKDKERINSEKDKRIYRYMSLFHSFLYDDEKNNPISEMLLEKYGVKSYDALMAIIIQALIYQRPAKIEDFIYKFEVKASEVSPTDWNYSEEYLKKIGKDSASRRQKTIDQLKSRLLVYDLVNDMLEIKSGGKGLIEKGIGLQWKIIDKNKVDPADVFENDFPVFLDGSVIFFRGLFSPLLSGELMVFHDREKKEIISSLFAKEIFFNEMQHLDRIINDFSKFRNENPMLVVPREEALRILSGRMTSMNHVENIVRNTGNLFYNIAQKLFPYYYRHRQWIMGENPKTKLSMIRTPIAADGEIQDPLPFYDCVIAGFSGISPITSSLEGKKIIGPSPGEGIIGYMLAYSYQAAKLCLNAELMRSIEERGKIMRDIDEIAGLPDGEKQ